MDDSSNPLIEGELDAADKDGFSLIDGSELDDLFVSMSDMGDNKVNMVDGGMNMPERAEKPRKNEKYNLRKSLAWDSAFFTSAGVLDAEEISTIMEGGNGGKNQLQHLPGIQEDVSKSTDSFSTLESDNLTLESLEADLFSDIRASIQRSGESSKSRNSKLSDRLEQTSHLGKKTEIKLGNMVKPKPTPKKINSNLQGIGKVTKLAPPREVVRKPVGSRKEPTSCLPKPAAASAKGSTIVMTPTKVPAKRMSISAGRIKTDNSHLGNEMAAGRVTTVSKGDRPGVPRSTIPKGASHSKSSPVSSTIPKVSSHAKPSSVSSTNTRTGISSTRSSIDRTSSSSSQSSRILPQNGMQGKSIKPASVSRLPSRVPMKTKNPPSNSRILAKLSASIQSSVSPTSSISEWSSCSSNFTANQEHSASNECSSLHRTFSLDSNASQDLQIHPNQVGSFGDEEVASSVSNSVSAKPSGLRMPSPKIGFFDGVKSGGRTQNAGGSKQSRLSSSRLPRSTPGNSSPGGVPNRGRIGNASVRPTALAGQNTKSNVTSSENFTKTTSLNTNEANNSGGVKLPVGEKQHPSARKKSITPQGKSKSLSNQVSSAVEADRHIKETDNELCGDTVNPELHSVNMSEVGNASEVGENANEMVPCGKCIEKNDPDCTVVNISEQEAGNAIDADENEDKSVQSGEADHRIKEMDNELCGDTVNTKLHPVNMSEVVNASEGENANTMVPCGKCEETIEKNDPDCTVVNISEQEAGNAIDTDENADKRVQSGEADYHIKETNSELCGDIVNPELLSVNMSEVGNESEVGENPNTMVPSGDCEETIEKNDSDCTAVNISEQEAGNAIEADENAEKWVQSGECEADNEKNDTLNTSEEAGEYADTVVLSPVPGECEADNEKNDPTCSVANISKEVSNDTSTEEEAGDAIKADKIADTRVQNGECETDNAKNDSLNTSEELDEYADTVVPSPVPGGCEADNEKNNPFSFVANISEEVFNDEYADTVMLSPIHGVCEAHNEKNDPFSFVANVSNDESSDTGPLCEEDNVNTVLISHEKHDPVCTEINISEEVGNAVKSSDNSDTIFTVKFSGLNEEENTANLHKQTDTCLSSKRSDSKPCTRTPFADKNSSPGKFSVDVLVKRFTSLSLDVETGNV